MRTSFTIDESDDVAPYNRINVWGYMWSVGLGQYFRPLSYQIQIDSGIGSTQSNDPVLGYYWLESCGYFNTTYNLDVDSSTNFGITIVNCDISDILLDNEQYVYTYAADVGDTQIELTC